MPEVNISVSVEAHDDGTVSITFNRVPIDELDAVFAEMGTVDGRNRFADGLLQGMAAKGIPPNPDT